MMQMAGPTAISAMWFPNVAKARLGQRVVDDLAIASGVAALGKEKFAESHRRIPSHSSRGLLEPSNISARTSQTAEL
jgi:hypothetical protein